MPSIDENRHLIESIEQQMEAKKMKVDHRDQLNERVKSLREHYQNAQNDVVQNLVRTIKLFHLMGKTFNLFLLFAEIT